MNCKLVFLVLTTLLGTNPASAAWSSGGGELIKDADNPWFLQNTNSVSYCIMVGRDFSEQSLGALDARVQGAVHFWRDRLAMARRHRPLKLPGGSVVQLATQVFRRLECSDPQVDVKFQFGVLTPKQRRFLGTPSKFVAIAVRTDYDPVSLRGKGFIYVSPDSGPDKYDEPHLVDRAWTQVDGGLVYSVLVHELGHVFGFPHVPSYAPGEGMLPGLMSENFAEYILNLDHYGSYSGKVPKLPFLIFDPDALGRSRVTKDLMTYVTWGLGGLNNTRTPAFAFFKSDVKEGEALSFVPVPDGVDVYQFSNGLINVEPHVLGRIVAAVPFNLDDPNLPYHVYPASHLYLTPEQRVFDLGRYAAFLPFSFQLSDLIVFSVHGTFLPRDGGDGRPVNIEIGAGSMIKISGTADGTEYPDLLKGETIFQ